MSATLLILAAGMGSRYGGLKQIDAFGPSGETILEYSIYDALQAGFDHVVLVIRQEFEQDFRDKLGSRFEGKIRVNYVYQPVNPMVHGIDLIEREKPRGTGHAVLVAKDVIDQPFCVINADDYYGRQAFEKMYVFLTQRANVSTCSMVGRNITKTLSDHGSVNRGVCLIDKKSSSLLSMKEYLSIARDEQGIITEPGGEVFADETIVSMTFLGFHTAFFDTLEEQFLLFLQQHKDELKTEFYLTTHGVDKYLQSPSTSCEVMVSQDRWYGVSYASDKPVVQQAMTQLIHDGVYSTPLRE